MHIFDVLVDGELVRGKSFRRWAPGICRLDITVRFATKSIKSHPHYREIRNAVAGLMICGPLHGEVPEHTANGTYIFMGTDELNEKYKKNKPKGTIHL